VPQRGRPVAGVADGDVQDMEVIVTQVYDCRTNYQHVAVLETEIKILNQRVEVLEGETRISMASQTRIEDIQAHVRDLEARLAQTDDALTGQVVEVSRQVGWLRSEILELRIRLDAYGVMIRRMENRIKEVSDGSANS
jgi:chromosome segregation ATPase